jgi:molecular chaperone IbpA
MQRPRVDSASLGYPPYNIEKTGEYAYRLTMAVAGFSPSEPISRFRRTLSW